jgi:Tfp pilus assembly protein PilF
MHRDYKTAVALYQKAVDLESQRQTLSRDMLRMVRLGQGMAYLMGRDLPGAKATLEQGIAQDPEYPMFYYLNARIYADSGKMNECLEQLRLAYKYQDNIIPGDDPLPDPLRTDSFRRFLKDPKFVLAVREIQRR